MPISAQEHRIRTGLYSSCKGVWLSHHKLKHFSPTTKTRSSKEETECDTTYLQLMWFLATVILLVPLMYTTTMIAITMLEVLLQINISTNGGADMVHDISHQAKLDLSWVIDIFHLVREICSWLVQRQRMTSLISLFCVLIISTVTAVVCFIRRKSKQSVHIVAFAQVGSKIVIVQSEVDKVQSVSLSCQRLMGVSLVVAILTAVIISILLIKSGDVELNPGPLTPNNLNQVFEAVYNVRPKWYEFGLALGLSPVDLESIKLDNHEKSETCLRVAILKRLGKDPLLTWNDIVRSLRQRSVKEYGEGIANEIEQKHHLKGSVGDYMTPIDQMRSALSGEPTLEELCSLPVEKVWYSLGLWLGVLQRIKKKYVIESTSLFYAYLSGPDIVEMQEYLNFVSSLSQDQKTVAEDFFEMKESPRIDKYEQLLKELPEKQRKAGEELLQKKLSKSYGRLVEALVKVGEREAAERVCSQIGVSLTAYLDATDPASNPPDCVVSYAKYLKSKYKQMSVLPDQDWPPALAKEQHFTNLALIQRDGHAFLNTIDQETMKHDYAHGKIDNIVARKHEIPLEEIFLPIIDEKSKESRLTILMDGAPGVGKTTLSRKFCVDWANGDMLQEYQLVILVPLREILLDQSKNLTIHNFLPADDLELKAKVVKHLRATSGANILFIFDGFDELSAQQRTRQSLFLDIIKGNQLHHSSVLVTARPYVSGPLLSMKRINRQIEVLGLTKAQITSCIFQNLPENEACLLEQKLQERLDVASVCYIPLNCKIVMYVFQVNKHVLPAILTQLYELFILHTIKHYADKIVPDPNIIEEVLEASSIQELPQYVQKQLDILSEVAFTGMEEDKLVFSKKELRQPENVLLLGLLNSMQSFNDRGVKQFFQFLHLTFQEYLAARHIAFGTMSDIQKLKFLTEKIESERFRMTLLFLSGLTHLSFLPQEVPVGKFVLGVQKFSESCEDRWQDCLNCNYLSIHECFLMYVQLLFESQLSFSSQSVLSCFQDLEVLDFSGYNLSMQDCLTLQRFFSLANHTWQTINFHNCDLTDHKLRVIFTGNFQQVRCTNLMLLQRGVVLPKAFPNKVSYKAVISVLDKMPQLVEITLPCPTSIDGRESKCAALGFSRAIVRHQTLQSITIGDALHLSRKVLWANFKMCSNVLETFLQFLRPEETTEISIGRGSDKFKGCTNCVVSDSESVEKAVSRLCDLVGQSNELTHFSLASCTISESMLSEIVEKLALKESLKLIDLSNTEVDKEMLSTLLQSLPIGTVLRICELILVLNEELHLTAKIREDVKSSHTYMFLFNALKDDKRLVALNIPREVRLNSKSCLSMIEFESDDIESFKEFLTNNTHLQELSIAFGPDTSNLTMSSIPLGFSQNTGLKKIHLEWSVRISPMTIISVLHFLNQCINLEIIELEGRVQELAERNFVDEGPIFNLNDVHIDADELLITKIEALIRNETLKDIKLSLGTSSTIKNCKKFQRIVIALQQNPNLKHFQMSNEAFGDSKFCYDFDRLSISPGLCRVCSSGLIQVFQLLKLQQEPYTSLTLERLSDAFDDCCSCEVSYKEVVNALCELIKSSKIFYLSLEDCKMSTWAIQLVFESLLISKTELKRLNVDGIDIDSESIGHLLENLPLGFHLKVHNFHVSIDPMIELFSDFADGHCFSMMLKSLMFVQRINGIKFHCYMHNNFIGSEAENFISELQELLQNNQNITTLDLEDSMLSHELAEGIIRVARETQCRVVINSLNYIHLQTTYNIGALDLVDSTFSNESVVGSIHVVQETYYSVKLLESN